MQLNVLREVTEWEDNTPNHDYVLNDQGKVVAYRKRGEGEWFIPAKPRMFSKSRRRFKKLNETFED
jgi:hypothetical protein